MRVDTPILKIFKRLTAESLPMDLEELIICDTSLDSLEKELLAGAILKLKKANIARLVLFITLLRHH